MTSYTHMTQVTTVTCACQRQCLKCVLSLTFDGQVDSHATFIQG